MIFIYKENCSKNIKKVVGDKNVVEQMLDEGSVKIDETVPLILKKILSKQNVRLFS